MASPTRTPPENSEPLLPYDKALPATPNSASESSAEPARPEVVASYPEAEERIYPMDGGPALKHLLTS